MCRSQLVSIALCTHGPNVLGQNQQHKRRLCQSRTTGQVACFLCSMIGLRSSRRLLAGLRTSPGQLQQATAAQALLTGLSQPGTSAFGALGTRSYASPVHGAYVQIERPHDWLSKRDDEAEPLPPPIDWKLKSYTKRRRSRAAMASRRSAAPTPTPSTSAARGSPPTTPRVPVTNSQLNPRACTPGSVVCCKLIGNLQPLQITGPSHSTILIR